MFRSFAVVAVLELLAAVPALQVDCLIAAEKVVYDNHFDDAPKTEYPEWSSSPITYRSRATGATGTLIAPAVQVCESAHHKQRFLGEFGGPKIDPTAKTAVEQTITLALDEVPPHKSLTVSFDLYVLHSWDGDSPAYGPDRWRVEVAGGSTLLNTTFSNNPKTATDASWQSYPKPHQLPQTGAVQKNSLGSSFFGDSTYHFSYRFNHSEKKLALRFSGDLFEGKGTNDESWGLDNVRVVASDKAVGKKADASPLLRRKSGETKDRQKKDEPAK